MAFIESIPPRAKVPHVLARFNTGTGRPLVEFHEALLRGESPFSIAERELMAAFVSGTNACRYCFGAHSAAARHFGVEPELLAALVTDIGTADVPAHLKPVLHFLRKLTLTPARMQQADADAVFAAGWTERALYDAVQICALYNFMNRFVEGLGLDVHAEDFDAEGRMIHDGGYAAMLGTFGIR